MVGEDTPDRRETPSDTGRMSFREGQPPAYYDASKLAYAAMGPMGARFDKLYEEMKKIAGLPLASKLDSKFMGFKIRTSSEATEVRKGPIPAGTFDPPPGYKKTKSPYEKNK